MAALVVQRYLRILLIVSFAILVAGNVMGQNFAGNFTSKTADGDNLLVLQQSGNSVTGSYTVGTTKLVFTGKVEGGKAVGTAKLEGTPVMFFVTFTFEGSKLVAEVTEQDDQGKPDPHTTEKTIFIRQGSAPAASAGTAPLDGDALKAVAEKVKSNFKREKATKVLSEGEPPLTVESVAAFAELMNLCFGASLTETEFGATSQHFIAYYEKSDASTKQMLALGWQRILDGIQKQEGEEKAKSIAEVRDVFASRFASGAQTGMPWAVAMNAAVQRRTNQVGKVHGELNADARKAGFRTEMTEADLDATMEMLYFMWVGAGRDSSLVTPEAVATVRLLIVQRFALFPPQVQAIIANGQKVYASLRGEWAQATPAHRLQMSQAFNVALDQLGLTVPRPQAASGSAWSDVGGQSHGEWAASMVQGLAGSSYSNAWSSH